MTYRHLTFIGMLLLCAIIGWTSGYDFNYRGPGVAIMVSFSIVFSFAVSLFASTQKVKLWNI